MSFTGFNVPIPFDRERYAREHLAETKRLLILAERARAARAVNAQTDPANAAGFGSDRGADKWAGDRDEDKGDQPNW